VGNVLAISIRMELLDEQRHQSRQCTIAVRRQVFVFQSAVLTFEAVVRRHTNVELVRPICSHPSLVHNQKQILCD